MKIVEPCICSLFPLFRFYDSSRTALKRLKPVAAIAGWKHFYLTLTIAHLRLVTQGEGPLFTVNVTSPCAGRFQEGAGHRKKVLPCLYLRSFVRFRQLLEGHLFLRLIQGQLTEQGSHKD